MKAKNITEDDFERLTVRLEEADKKASWIWQAVKFQIYETFAKKDADELSDWFREEDGFSLHDRLSEFLSDGNKPLADIKITILVCVIKDYENKVTKLGNRLKDYNEAFYSLYHPSEGYLDERSSYADTDYITDISCLVSMDLDYIEEMKK